MNSVSGSANACALSRADEAADLRGLHPLGAIFRVVLDGFVLLQRLEAAALDHRVVNENVTVVPLVGDETKPLLIVEPLDLTGGHLSHSFGGRASRRVRGRYAAEVFATRYGCVRSEPYLFPNSRYCGTYDPAEPFPCGIRPCARGRDCRNRRIPRGLGDAKKFGNHATAENPRKTGFTGYPHWHGLQTSISLRSSPVGSPIEGNGRKTGGFCAMLNGRVDYTWEM